MGIYAKDAIFGIKIYNFNEDDFATILFEEKYSTPMTSAQLNKAYTFYTKLDNKTEIRLQYYTECSSEGTTYFDWVPMTLHLLLEKLHK